MMTICQMTAAIRNNQLTSRELVMRYLEKIKSAKHLNAVMELNPDALALAERLDSSREKNGSLYGIPVLLKDNISTTGPMRTTAGSLALAENIAPIDAPVVKALRQAGAIILGKTNMTEFANYMAKKMPNGYSSRGGQTLNFFDPAADPSGSSSGSAVAVAADLCAAAVGTETSGSIISPAQHAGIVGIKPTAGLISSEAIIPISSTLDTAGPMTRCVEDAGLMLGVLAGKNYSVAPAPDLLGIRIGIYRHFTDNTKNWYNQEWIAANERLVPVMKSLGAVCVELPAFDTGTKYLGPIMRYEFKFALNRYLRSMKNPAIPRNLKEIIAYNESRPEAAMKFGHEKLVNAEQGVSGNLNETEYTEALAAREAAIQTFDAVFTKNNIDIFFMIAGDFSIAAGAGFPSLTLPAGRTSGGLAIGSFFAAQRFREDKLLRTAAAVQNNIL